MSDSAEQFALDFTEHIETLGSQYAAVGELLSLYRLYDLLYHLRHVGLVAPPALKYWTDHYKHPYTGPPATMPTLSRKKTYRWRSGKSTYTLEKSIKGGVLMRVNVDKGSLLLTPTQTTARWKSRILGNGTQIYKKE